MNATEYTSSPPTADDDRAASDDICITTAPATDIPSQLTKAQSSAPTLEEVLTQTSTTDTLISSIAGTVEDFAGKDEAFRKELRKRLFQLVLKKYAWWSARLVHERNVHNYDLEREITELQQAEVERGKSPV